MKKSAYILPLVGLVASCSPQTYAPKDAVVIGRNSNSVAESKEVAVQPVLVQKPLTGMMPKATAFKMTGDYANNVAVTIGSNGELTYYPAPSDITNASAPTSIADGRYLNNQGLSANSVFTKYTYEEYSKLPSVPSQEELKAAIIPGARVADMIQLPYTIGDAKNNLQGIKEYIKNL